MPVVRLLAQLTLVALIYLFLYRAAVLAGFSRGSSFSRGRGGRIAPAHQRREEDEDIRREASELELEAGPGGLAPGERFSLGANTILGRAAESDVVIDDPYVSARHAEVTRTGAGYKLRDLGSTNGTYVNGRRIRGECVLRPGDRVRLGDTILKFRG
ncbi:MAG: FHA domain-containing protein [Bacillota bacterium]